MIKLIATDIDGTLLKDGTLMIDPEYMTVIEKLTSKGIIFVACSGRQRRKTVLCDGNLAFEMRKPFCGC